MPAPVALVDCSNFYASCERVFQPGLRGRPIVVLSNNDGCVIARSNEAKALGIEMGDAWHLARSRFAGAGVIVRSSNYALYGDMSARVAEILRRFTPSLEIYSIDEAFLDLDGFGARLDGHARDLRATVLQWTGIPVSVGIAPTKTLAKLANRFAKKNLGRQSWLARCVEEAGFDGLWRRGMGRVSARPRPERERVLMPTRQACPGCGGHMRLRYENRRTLVTLSGPVRLRLRIRRCEAPDCPRCHIPYRPEAECALALPQHEFGLDVIALIGVLRHREHRSVPEIHAALWERGVVIAERSVTNLLDRYDELLATSLTSGRRLRRMLKDQGGVILALDGLQPDVGHEVLWVVRDCLSGQILLARSLLSATAKDLVPLLREVIEAIGAPVLGVVSDGQISVRRAVAEVMPGVPHQLCQFHFLREAAHPVFEADRHAKVELKKQVRGVRPIERALEGREDPAAEVARGYCAAVRSAITDDGRIPLAASGLKLKARLEAVADSLDRIGEKGVVRRRSRGCAN